MRKFRYFNNGYAEFKYPCDEVDGDPVYATAEPKSEFVSICRHSNDSLAFLGEVIEADSVKQTTNEVSEDVKFAVATPRTPKKSSKAKSKQSAEEAEETTSSIEEDK